MLRVMRSDRQEPKTKAGKQTSQSRYSGYGSYTASLHLASFPKRSLLTCLELRPSRCGSKVAFETALVAERPPIDSPPTVVPPAFGWNSVLLERVKSKEEGSSFPAGQHRSICRVGGKEKGRYFLELPPPAAIPQQ